MSKAGSDFVDAGLPVSGHGGLLVGEGREKGRDGGVGGDAGDVDGDEEREEVGVVEGGEEDGWLEG